MEFLSFFQKVAWVKANHYGGVFVWEISQDDFQGLGGAGKFPLLCAIRDVLTDRERVTPPTPRDVALGSGTSQSAGKFHVVKAGDTAYNIALLYGMTLDELQKLNPNKKNLALIQPGDKIGVNSEREAAGN